MNVKLYFQSYNMLSYEKELAKREVKKLINCDYEEHEDHLLLKNPNNWESMVNKLTYFEKAISQEFDIVVPIQTYFEASPNYTKEQLDYIKTPKLNNQVTRYSAHDLHEYKGKFNPQIIRAIGNILNLKENSWVLDPFCGCGTTLIEAIHCGWNSMGIDLNPLAVKISEAKIKSLTLENTSLIENSKLIKNVLQNKNKDLKFDKQFSEDEINQILDINLLKNIKNYDYLIKWFKQSVLVQMVCIIDQIDKIDNEDTRLIFKIILSDIVRNVSLQDEGDLRIRKKKDPSENEPAIQLFIKSLDEKINKIISAKNFLKEITTTHNVMEADSRECIKLPSNYQKFDAIITSPPYATALPYIDIHRLSMVLLGLIDSKEIMIKEKSLIGSREITPNDFKGINDDLLNNRNKLPDKCADFCIKLANAYDKKTDGFRRKNEPVLVYKYLSDMSLTFKQIYKVMNNDGDYAMIIGRNKTCLGGKEFVIDNPVLLTEIAESNNYKLKEIIELNTYKRFDMHSANSIKTESLVIYKPV